MKIHKTAIVDEKAQLSADVEIGPYTIIGAGAVVGEKCVIQSNVVIEGSVVMGTGNFVGHGAIIAHPRAWHPGLAGTEDQLYNMSGEEI